MTIISINTVLGSLKPNREQYTIKKYNNNKKTA